MLLRTPETLYHQQLDLLCESKYVSNWPWKLIHSYLSLYPGKRAVTVPRCHVKPLESSTKPGLPSSFRPNHLQRILITLSSPLDRQVGDQTTPVRHSHFESNRAKSWKSSNSTYIRIINVKAVTKENQQL